MLNQNRSHIGFTGFLLLGLWSLVALGSGDLPESWYVHPEDQPLGYQTKDTATLHSRIAQAQNLSTLLTRIYDTNQKTFERLPDYPSSSTQNLWHLGNFSTELSLTVGGQLGILGIKGISNTFVFWSRRGTTTYSNLEADSPAARNVLISGEQNKELILAEIEPIVRIAKSRGVKPIKQLRKNLLQAALDFQTLALGIENSSTHRWRVCGFRFDFMIGARGNLTPITVPASIGGDLRFRFEWFQKPGQNVLARLQPRPKLAENLYQWIRKMRWALADFPAEALPGFNAKRMGFGIGITGGLDVGLAKGSAEAIGFLIFEPNPNYNPQFALSTEETLKATENLSDQILVIESAQSSSLTQHLDYANQTGIRYSKFSGSLNANPRVGQVGYYANLKDFSKGLKKAAKIAKYFLKPSRRLAQRKWAVSNIVLAFSLNITGGIGLVTLGGDPTVIFAYAADKI